LQSGFKKPQLLLTRGEEAQRFFVRYLGEDHSILRLKLR
jgi:hypothetical protein